MPKKRKKRYLCRTIRTDADNVMVHVELVTRKRNVLRVEMCYCPSGYAALSTYSEDKPLFGRSGAHGNFWIPAHVRGTTERGVVVKDYAVQPPVEENDDGPSPSL